MSAKTPTGQSDVFFADTPSGALSPSLHTSACNFALIGIPPPPRPPWPLKSILDMQGRVSTMCSEETEAYLTCKAPELNPTAWWT